jgi:hypothetical protein
VIKAEGYGMANVELTAPSSKDTIYEIGSKSPYCIVFELLSEVFESLIRLT